ncbi:transcription termination/antitermination protein NusG [Stratiformator vulcanicus]|uniref:Transcription termination/antitermination protein NusG n=1 Tax=Stratiformator vulcanicus TaxID=2527980 RepID=A0A517R0J4_9PLAN|nr:transcription termination/antitermination protein NusG [Stratiformator vulcanicus]QDT37391.1 hypothetical protein Pan189_17700 [Stratiformator vulcanicus]
MDETPDSGTTDEAAALQTEDVQTEVEQSSDSSEPSGSPESEMQWYVLKVTSNREKTVKQALEKRIKREGLEEFFGEVLIPTRKIVDSKGGKKRTLEEKVFPGYMMIQMILNDDSWYLVRDTTGVGDFTGAVGEPTPMRPEEVDRMLGRRRDEESGDAEPTKVKIDFSVGEIVKIKDGPFESFEGTIEGVDDVHGKVVVLIEIFGRPTETELDYWQVEKV